MEGRPRLAVAGANLLVASESASLSARSLSADETVWTADAAASIPLTVAEDLALTVSGGQLRAFDVTTGAPRWTTAADDVAFPPLVLSGRVVLSSGSALRAVRSTDGTPLWRQDLGAAALVPPAGAVDGVVTALADRTLALIDLETGQVRWRVPLEVTPVALAGAGDRVYDTSTDGLVCAHKRDKGDLDWCFRVRVPPLGAPALDDRELGVAFLDNALRIFDRRSGTLQRTVQFDVRAVAGPQITPQGWLIPLATSEVLLVPRDPKAPSVRAFTRAEQPGPPLQAFAFAPDGSVLALASVSSTGRTLAVYHKREK
jgi:outer membrane protein assembly factor BamB